MCKLCSNSSDEFVSGIHPLSSKTASWSEIAFKVAEEGPGQGHLQPVGQGRAQLNMGREWQRAGLGPYEMGLAGWAEKVDPGRSLV